MEVLRSKEEARGWSRAKKEEGRTVAFVPTMGSLHEGHLALVRQARQEERGAVVVSVYVNEAQFGPGEDFESYPRDREADKRALEGLADAVFTPAGGLYGGEHQTYVEPVELEKPLCGRKRPQFFRGVATVVAKLFNILEPDVALFGKKDYQQLVVVRALARELDFPVRVDAGELVRDGDGLALSSRNGKLSSQARSDALALSKGLFRAQEEALSGGVVDCRRLERIAREAMEARSDGLSVEYVEAVACDSLESASRLEPGHTVVLAAAATAGGVRLTDNVEIRLPGS